MIAHQVADALKGTGNDLKLAVPNVDTLVKRQFLDWMAHRAAQIIEAQKFEFENVPVGASGDGSFDLPGLEGEELQFLADGLIPVPFPLCWFEAEAPSLGGRTERMCFLIEEDEGVGYDITPFRVFALPEGRAVQFTGETWRVIRLGASGRPEVEVFDPFGGGALMDSIYTELGAGGGITRETMAKGETGFVAYLLLMLVSKSTETLGVAAPDKLNKARARKGKAPITAHRVVSIVPRGIAKTIRDSEQGAVGGGTGLVRSSPRMHWRRSHLRILPSGNTVVVARALVGYKASDGRELVTHDYRVSL